MAGDTSKVTWKPSSERNGNLVILFPYRAGNVVLRDAEGNVIARGTSSGPSNGWADTIRFNRPGARFANVTVEDDAGGSFTIDDGAKRFDGISSGATGEDTSVPDGSDDTSTGVDSFPSPELLDPNLISTPDPISFPDIPKPDFIDPLETTRKVGDFNREQSEQNFIRGIERARELSSEELASIQEFAKGISDTQLELLDAENTFSQQQRLQAADTAIPGVQDIFARQRERAETLAEGRFLDTAQDRAFELASRSAAAEGAITRGFGDDSVVGRKQSDLLSAQQRLGLQQVGEGFLASSLQQAAGLLFDVPTKPNVAQRLPVQPAVPLTQLATTQQNIENQLTTVSPQFVQSNLLAQEQLETQVNLAQAQGDFAASQFNTEQERAAELNRLRIIEANRAAGNEAAREEFGFGLRQQERDQLFAYLRENLDIIKDSKKRDQFIQGLGAIFNGIANIPDGAYDLIKEFTGIDFRRDSSTDVEEGGNRPPQVDREDETGEDPDPQIDDPGDEVGFEDEAPQEESGDAFEGGEGSGIPKVALSRRKFRKLLIRSGLNRAEVRARLRSIDEAPSLNTGLVNPVLTLTREDLAELRRIING